VIFFERSPLAIAVANGKLIAANIRNGNLRRQVTPPNRWVRTDKNGQEWRCKRGDPDQGEWFAGRKEAATGANLRNLVPGMPVLPSVPKKKRGKRKEQTITSIYASPWDRR